MHKHGVPTAQFLSGVVLCMAPSGCAELWLLAADKGVRLHWDKQDRHEGLCSSQLSISGSVNNQFLPLFQTVKGMLDNPNEPVSDLSYFDCIEGVMENSKVISFFHFCVSNKACLDFQKFPHAYRVLELQSVFIAKMSATFLCLR